MKTALYLGTDPTEFLLHGGWEGHLIHYPVIQIVPRPKETLSALQTLSAYTHLIFTSKHAVQIFFSLCKDPSALIGKRIIAVGKVTAAHLVRAGYPPTETALLEQQEGILELLAHEDLSSAHIFLPCSSLARDTLPTHLSQKGARVSICDLYDTLPYKDLPLPDLDLVDALIFTSPSTVHAFLSLFGRLPTAKQLLAIGPITQNAIRAGIAACGR